MHRGDFLICIFLVGNSEDIRLYDYFYRKLQKKLPVLSISADEILKNGSENELVLVRTDLIPKINTPYLLILGKNASRKSIINLENCTFAIVSSDSEKQLKVLSNHSVPAITCGNSPKDTISYTSQTDESIVLSLQRTIEFVNGRTAEPFEIPRPKSGLGDYADLAFFAFCVEIGLRDNNFL